MDTAKNMENSPINNIVPRGCYWPTLLKQLYWIQNDR